MCSMDDGCRVHAMENYENISSDSFDSACSGPLKNLNGGLPHETQGQESALGRYLPNQG